jgi:Transglycosylase SLT domain
MVYRAALVLLLLTSAASAQTLADPAAEGRSRYAPLLTAEAVRRNIPPALADAVATVESAYDAGARGSSGEVGLMQVLPSTADMLGFRGDLAQLADPETNIRLGVKYLAGAWEATGGRMCDTLMKYRAGYGASTMSLRSAIYCRRAINYLTSIGSPLATGPGTEIPLTIPDTLTADTIIGRTSHDPVPMLLTRAELVRMRKGQRTAEDSQRYWAAWEAHIRDLRSQMDLQRRARSSRYTSNVVLNVASSVVISGRDAPVPGGARHRPKALSR